MAIIRSFSKSPWKSNFKYWDISLYIHSCWSTEFWTSSARTAWRRRPLWIVCPSEPFLGDQNWSNRRERGLDCMEGDREPPIWISARVPWLCWPYEALHCRGAEWLHGWACLVVSIWSLGEGWSRFANNAGHSLLSRAAGILSEGGRLVQRRTSALVWMALDFFGDGDPGCFNWRLCRFDCGSKWWHQDSSSATTIAGTHSIPWHSAADDQYSGSCINSSWRFSVTLHTVQISLPALRHFWSPKRGSEGQTIHLGRRRQAVSAELVHNAAPGILRDRHSPPCVAVGQVPQQPGPILLTYRYWFLFLGLRIVSF